jgi:hypothetical protein
MNIIGLICILIAQFFSGAGIVRLFRIQLSTVPSWCLSMITGVALTSFVPCFMQLLGIPITHTYTAISIGLFTALCSIPLILPFRMPRLGTIVLPKMYELPFILVFLFLIVSSLWRCFYFPPTPRDVLAGAELLAEFTVREHTMVNSVYSIDLHTTNNQFKSPYLTSLQIIYKLYVCPFGQLWLGSLFVPLVIWLYNILRDRIHSLLACMVLLMYFAIPDAFAYTYIMLYDFSNMVFFFSGFYFLTQYILHKRQPDFAFSVFLFGIATYIRVETLVLVALVSLMPAFNYYKEKLPLPRIALRTLLLMAGPVFFYIVCMHIFIPNFVPAKLDTAGQINQNLTDVSAYFTRLSAINDLLIFSEKGVLVFGYYMYFFMAILTFDLIFIRKFTREARMALFGIGVVYFGLAFLGYLLPLFDVLNTTKRGLFKVIPLISLYYANSGMITRISDYLKRKELKASEPDTQTTTAPRPVVASAKQKEGKAKK